MPQSLANLLVHITFSIKERRALQNHDLRDEMHRYIAGVSAKLAPQPDPCGREHLARQNHNSIQGAHLPGFLAKILNLWVCNHVSSHIKDARNR